MDKLGKLSRRNVLLASGAAIAAAGAIVVSPVRQSITRRGRRLVAARPWGRAMLSLADGSYDEWLAQVGSVFAVGGGTAIRLAGVKALQSGGERPLGIARDRAFAAFFDPVGGTTMAGDLIYTAYHPEYGPLSLFLAASGDRSNPARMIAVFN